MEAHAFGTLPTLWAQSITLNFNKRLQKKKNEIYHIYVITIITTCTLPIHVFLLYESFISFLFLSTDCLPDVVCRISLSSGLLLVFSVSQFSSCG